MTSSEANVGSLRQVLRMQNVDVNNDRLYDGLDDQEGQRDLALLRMQNYQQLAGKYYNKKVHNRIFQVGDLVLRKVYDNTKEEKAAKLGAKWEGLYLVSEVVNPGIYKLMDMNGTAIPLSWNAWNLKRYY